jgi:hypothetical protein
MTISSTSMEHIILAARARSRLRDETSEIARAIHLRIARLHEARAGMAQKAY